MRVVAITGASAGIGRATALRLARTGGALAICARRADRLAAVADEIRAAGGSAMTVVADVRRAEDMDRFVAAAVERFGRLDVMICNAGFGIAGAIDDIAPEQMRNLIDVNYMGTFFAARAALRVFRQQGSEGLPGAGHIVIVSSIAGKRGVPYMAAYAATKFAQVGMAECLRSEVAGTDIHVSVVADAIARAIAHPVAEVYPHFPSRALVWLNAFAPALTDRVVKRFGRKPVRPERPPAPA